MVPSASSLRHITNVSPASPIARIRILALRNLSQNAASPLPGYGLISITTLLKSYSSGLANPGKGTRNKSHNPCSRLSYNAAAAWRADTSVTQVEIP